ncbi:ribonuclease H1 small subunit [Massarina eburnea CBS 473.64]|uniref:Ribonuclease H1 small subunit n=1 Tax=Massarina eburnea CBS 473.64 TaxID=1395130 RepID=A0A6A6SDK1_9PLEO|nr:ribonuclease H1 small subunit [Massarina eburnea CBS 473.64]
MLAIQPKTSQKSTPNLLPMRINHNGPVNDTERYFQPTKDPEGTSHAYLRGRHLHGTTVSLPSNYTGAVLHITDKNLPQKPPQISEDGDDEEDEDVREEVKIAEMVGEFDEVVVWGHGESVDTERDAFVRGVNEWVGFAESMHQDEDEGEQGNNGKKEG